MKLIRLVFLTLCLSALLFGQSENPSISELEALYGSHTITPQSLVEYELAAMEKFIQKEDSVGFLESFEEQIVSLNNQKYANRKILERLIGIAIKSMGQRGLGVIDSMSFARTFDFNIRNRQVTSRSNRVDVSGVFEFTYLQTRSIINSDTTYASFNKPFVARFYKNGNKMRIRSHQGIIDFFLDSILLVSEKDKKLKKHVQKFEAYRTGYPGSKEIISREEL